MVDAARAVVDVERYLVATSQIAQTTLRSVLGKADLDMLLAEREQLNEALQHIIDEQTDPWGIKVTTVEIKDVEIPTAMQRAMALGAEAERERRAKIIHAEGEFQASKRLRDAAEVIAGNPAALQLRYLQTLTEIGAPRTRRSSSRCRSTSSSRSSTPRRRSSSSNRRSRRRPSRATARPHSPPRSAGFALWANTRKGTWPSGPVFPSSGRCSAPPRRTAARPGGPRAIDQARRMYCACVQASGVAERVSSPAGSLVGGRPSQTCSGRSSPSLAVRAIVRRCGIALRPAISAYSPRSPVSSGHRRPNVCRAAVGKMFQSAPVAVSP